MSGRISDETLDACIYTAQLMGSAYVEAGLIEAKQSRALVTELRALLIRVESFTMQIPSSEIHAAAQDYARSIAAQLDSLISAHTEAKP